MYPFRCFHFILIYQRKYLPLTQSYSRKTHGRVQHSRTPIFSRPVGEDVMAGGGVSALPRHYILSHFIFFTPEENHEKTHSR